MSGKVDVHVGMRIRQRRRLLGMTQKELAERSGVRFQQIQKYESGQNRVPASRLWEIARSQSVPVEYYFEGLDASEPDGSETALIDPKRPGQAREALEFLRMCNAMGGERREQMISLARSMIETERTGEG